jgi:hypothetical protein
MHSGFAALRTFLPMDFGARFGPPGQLLAPVVRDIERVLALWADCRHAATTTGPFLFGGFTIADAMFAPVCSRFTTYAVPLGASAQAYVAHIMGLPAMREWGRLAQAEVAAGGTRPIVTEPEPVRPAPVVAAPAPRVAPPAPPPPAPAQPERAPSPPAAEDPQRGPRPIPTTIMVKPIGDGTRRRR